MNTCKESNDKQLQDYFMNRLGREEMEAFQFHLFQCEACRVKLEQMRHLSSGLAVDVSPVSDTEKPDDALRRHMTFPLFTRVAAVVGLLLLLAGGSYYFMYIPSDNTIPLEINEPPVLHSSDSVVTDSTKVERIKEDIYVE